MVEASKLFFLSGLLPASVKVIMNKKDSTTSFKFYDNERFYKVKLKVVLFKDVYDGFIVCYDLFNEDKGSLAEDTSKSITLDNARKLIAALAYDVFR